MRRNRITIICLGLLLGFINHSNALEAKQIKCTGRVVDTQGKPIAGARVAAHEMHSDGVAGNILLRQVGESTTSSDGALVFASEPRPTRGTFLDGYVVVTKQGLALGWAIWNMREDAEVNIELGEPKRLEGVIVDEKGEPIAGAEVRANLLRIKETAQREESTEWLPGIKPLAWLRTETNNRGRFQFDNIPEDSGVDLLVTAPGKATIYTYQFGPPPQFEGVAGSRFKAGQTDIKVTLPAEARIEGRVVENDSGKGVAGLELAVVPRFSSAFFYRSFCVSEEDGSFGLGGLQSGEYLMKGDFPSFSLDVESGRSTDVLIGLNPQRVVTPEEQATGEPVSNASIQIGLKVVEGPEGMETDLFGQNESLSNGMFVHKGQEYADRLLELSRKSKGAKVISSPQVAINDGQEATISLRKMMTYIAGYESARNGSGKLIAQHQSLFVGIEYTIRGILMSGDRIHIKLTAKQQSPVFETRQYRKGYDYQIPLPAEYLVTDVIANKNEPVVIGRLRRDKPSLFLVLTASWWSLPGKPESLVGKPLPGLDDIKTEFNLKQAEGRPILVCFWDMQQRPSRNCLRQLSKRAEELKAKDLSVVAVQASETDEGKLNDWVKKNNIPFPVGMIEGKEEQTRFNWGVKSLPWLILTDRRHVVTAEGFGIEEIVDKIKNIEK